MSSVTIPRYFIGSIFFLSIFFVALQPSWMQSLSAETQFVFWLGLLSCCVPVLIFVQNNLCRHASLLRHHSWGATLVSASISCVILTPVSLGFDFLFGMDDWEILRSKSATAALLLEELKALWFPLTVTWMGLNAPYILRLNFQHGMEQPNQHEQPQPSKSPAAPDLQNTAEAFLESLPPVLGHDIIYMQAELHYLRVVTVKGDTLLLDSLQRAITCLDDAYNGFHIHRSYWVNIDHVQKVFGTQADKKVTLSNGVTLPVSRRRAKEFADLTAV